MSVVEKTDILQELIMNRPLSIPVPKLAGLMRLVQTHNSSHVVKETFWVDGIEFDTNVASLVDLGKIGTLEIVRADPRHKILPKWFPSDE